MRRSYYLILLILSATLCGCDPYRFRAATKNPVQCRIFTSHRTVDSHIYGFDMHPDAVLQVTSMGWTQYELAAFLTLSRGEGFQLMLRPIVEESVVDSGLVLTFSGAGGMHLDSSGYRLEENSAFRFPRDSQTYITIYNEESFVQVTVGCDTVLKRFTKRKSSDDIALRTLAGSELKVVDPQWKQIKFREEFEVRAEQVRE